ncbi:MAG: hypothetical protein ACXW6T_24655, partial [Candidatus Binatia bacterium]
AFTTIAIGVKRRERVSGGEANAAQSQQKFEISLAKAPRPQSSEKNVKNIHKKNGFLSELGVFAALREEYPDARIYRACR